MEMAIGPREWRIAAASTPAHVAIARTHKPVGERPDDFDAAACSLAKMNICGNGKSATAAVGTASAIFNPASSSGVTRHETMRSTAQLKSVLVLEIAD